MAWAGSGGLWPVDDDHVDQGWDGLFLERLLHAPCMPPQLSSIFMHTCVLIFGKRETRE